MADLTHPVLESISRALPAPSPRATESVVPEAAVAAMLRVRADASLELLLIRRAEREGDVWSGHVAFPGGRREPGDHDLVATAIRETREEVAIDLGAAGCVLLGALPELRPRSERAPQICVQPFVWSVPDWVEPTGNHEVAAVRWVPLALLEQPDARIEHRLMTPDGRELSFPATSLGEDVLWGLTHRMVEDLLRAARG